MLSETGQFGGLGSGWDAGFVVPVMEVLGCTDLLLELAICVWHCRHSFMTSRLGYCNALLGGCPASSINKLHVVQNAAARVFTRSRKYDHITPILQSLHWLPIKFHSSYKILLLACKALNDLAPAYLTNFLSRYNPTGSLRSQNSGLLVVPRIAKSTKGGRTFSYLAPKLE